MKRLIQFFLWAVFVQVLIGILVWKFPPAGRLFKVFLAGSEEGLGPVVTDVYVRRFRILIGNPEPTGEILALVAPLALCKYFLDNRKIYLAMYFTFALGELLTATRSTTLLFVAGTVITLILFSKRTDTWKIARLLIAMMFIGVLVVAFTPGVFSSLVDRLGIATTEAARGGRLSDILNRGPIWEGAVSNLKQTGILGHGFLPTGYYVAERQNFHNLYMTIIYQFGWGGAIFFFMLLFVLWKNLYAARNAGRDEDFLLASSCWISMSLFLVNEIKYEFKRHASYSQLIWALLACFCLVAFRHKRERRPSSVLSELPR